MLEEEEGLFKRGWGSSGFLFLSDGWIVWLMRVLVWIEEGGFVEGK